jgi:VanZ family protein
VYAVVFYVRKGAHVAEYAVLALLLWAAIRKTLGQNSRPWHASRVALVIGFAFLYAASDEMHQATVPNRDGRFHDVLIDTTGASLGLFGLWLFGKWRARRGQAAAVTESSLPENAP